MNKTSSSSDEMASFYRNNYKSSNKPLLNCFERVSDRGGRYTLSAIGDSAHKSSSNIFRMRDPMPRTVILR